MFKNRIEAGRLLAVALSHLKAENPVIYGLPRGGVPVAAQVAVALSAPLDVVFVRKIGVPGQPELALGAVVDGASPVIEWNDDLVRALGLAQHDLYALAARQLQDITRRRQIYLGGREQLSAKGRTAILVDDGIATGASTKAAIRALRAQEPRRIVLAVPVAPMDTVQDLRDEVDELVVLEMPDWFPGVGAFYDDFSQTSDQEVITLLRNASGLA